ncbi:MAG: hypothetical protein ABIQ62_08685 [Thermomonas sp.]
MTDITIVRNCDALQRWAGRTMIDAHYITTCKTNAVVSALRAHS